MPFSGLGAVELAALQALGAHVHLATVPVDHDVDPLDVGGEHAVHGAVGVADGAAGNGVLAADLTNLGHETTSVLQGRAAPATTQAVPI